eukprot:4055855-Lingulodinium_polyedra.AAC.1
MFRFQGWARGGLTDRASTLQCSNSMARQQGRVGHSEARRVRICIELCVRGVGNAVPAPACVP